MDRIPHAVLGSAAAAIAVVLAVAGVERFDTDPAPRLEVASPPIVQRSPFGPVPDAKREQRGVSSTVQAAVPRIDMQPRALAGDERKAAMEAVTALAEASGEQAESILSDVVLSHADPAVREEAVYALSGRRGPIALDTLQQALRDSSPRVRDAAIRALADADPDDAATLLNSALHAQDTTTRLRAIDALGETGGAEATRYIEQMLGDESGVVREAAAEWLAELSDHN